MSKAKSPVRQYRQIIKDSGDPGYVNRILIATPTTGLVRIEWVQARYGQIIPVNWSQVTMLQFMESFIPLRYQVADAQNLIVKECIEKDYEWLFLLEHDTCPPPDAFIKINQYMIKASHPVVSGLYYTRGRPSEPLIFRGRGTGAFYDWKMGDMVYCDGVPTGCLLVHAAILREMWKDSPEYMVKNDLTRRVFDTPRNIWFDPQTEQYNSAVGTSDLDWCTRVIKGDYMRKAGWGDYVDKLPDQQWPFVVDTNIFCKHINPTGEMFP